MRWYWWAFLGLLVFTGVYYFVTKELWFQRLAYNLRVATAKR